MKRAALVLLAVNVVAGAILGHLAVRSNLAEAEQRLATATADLDTAEAELDAVWAELSDARTRGWEVGLRTDTQAWRAQRYDGETARVVVETDYVRGESTTTEGQIGTANAELDEVRGVLQSRANRLETVRACLAGVQGAASRSRVGDVGGAVGLLRGVVSSCRSVLASGTGAVYPFDFPDPSIVRDGGRYYAYATNSAGGPVQLITSTDMVDWEPLAPALTTLPGWAVAGATWAPAVARVGGGWVLYYTARHRLSGRQCISAATASSPVGPFTDGSAAPLVCELGEGGSIDPSPFVAGDGSVYLLWKSEGEVVGRRAQIRAQQLTPDGLAMAADTQPSILIGTDQGWEGRTVEGPTMIATELGFVLLYSANSWNSPAYVVGGAVCDTPVGPCRKIGRLFGTDSAGAPVGPGGPAVFVDGNGAARFAYHAWQNGLVGWPNPRFLHVGSVSVEGGRIVLRA